MLVARSTKEHHVSGAVALDVAFQVQQQRERRSELLNAETKMTGAVGEVGHRSSWKKILSHSMLLAVGVAVAI